MAPLASLDLEKRKIDLAYSYKILAYLGLDDHTYTHLSARHGTEESFYIYPFGLRFEEVTPSCLMHISFEGEVLQGIESQYNKTGYVIHGNLYRARPDIQAIFHVHTPEIVAVASCRDGLLPLSQWALHFYNQVAYHPYSSLALCESQGESLARDLGDKFALLMENHGAVICGRTLPEALFYTYHLSQACKTQVLALSTGKDLILPSAEICEKAVQDLLSFEPNLGMRDWQAWTRLIDQHYPSNNRRATYGR